MIIKSVKLNKCIYCHKQIDYRSKRCKSCEMATRIMSKKTKLKLSDIRIKKELSKGKNNPNYKDGRTLLKKQCIICNKSIGWDSTYCNICVHKARIKYPDVRYCSCGRGIAKYNKSGLCRSCSMIGKKYPYLSERNKKYIPKPTWIKYKNTWFRSSWESIFAQWLTVSGYKWKYEPKIFFFKNTSYTPDFYLPDFDVYIEIKGWFPINIQKKLQTFCSLFKHIKLQVFTEKELKEISCL